MTAIQADRPAVQTTGARRRRSPPTNYPPAAHPHFQHGRVEVHDVGRGARRPGGRRRGAARGRCARLVERAEVGVHALEQRRLPGARHADDDDDGRERRKGG